jgi:hypothetical protein
VMWAILEHNRGKHIQEQLFPSLASASASYEYLTEHRINRLREYSRNLLASDLPVYMQFLNENREAMRDILTRTRQEFPVRKNVRPDRLLEFVYQHSKEIQARLLDVLSKKATRSLQIEDGYGGFLRDYVLASCLAEADPWSVCYFKMAWLPLTQIIFPTQKKDFGRAFPELFVLVDADMTTRLLFSNLQATVANLVVHPKKDQSFKDALDEALFEAGTRYKDHIFENFAQTGPVLKDLQTSFKGSISSYFTLGDKVYVIVASRIEDDKGGFLGAVLVGYEVGTAVAWEDTATTLGIRPILQQCLRAQLSPSDKVSVNENLCEYEMSKQENGVTYLFRNKKGQTIRAGTSLRAGTANRLSQEARAFGPEPTRTIGNLLAMAKPVPVDFVPEGESLRAVLTVDVEAAVAPFDTMKLITIVLGVFVFLIGLVVAQFLARSFAKPFERIDAGIHEIIGGNFEYSFPFNFRDELPRSMAQSLTIMKAVLLGLPLPEDQERDDSWASNLRVEGESLPAAVAPSEGPAIEEISASQLNETATEYYRRLFKEYISAKEKVGEDTSKITYIKFVEKVAKTEKALRERFDAKQIVLRVQTKERQVVLVPLKVVD